MATYEHKNRKGDIAASPNSKQLSGERISAIENAYSIRIAEQRLNENSYSSAVWNLRTEAGEEYVLKLKSGTDEDSLSHLEAEIRFTEIVNNKLRGILETVRFVASRQGSYYLQLDPSTYAVLFEQAEIIGKSKITEQEQRRLGKLMALLHNTLRDFDHPGLWGTEYMRVLKEEELTLLEKVFPDKGYEPYLQFMRPLNYERLGLPQTVIHGDWHQANMSFTEPPILFDLETLAKGSRIEEIARTVTHWNFPTTYVRQFFKNLVEGYGSLTEVEIELAPKLMIAQLYRKYFEFLDYNDPSSAERTASSIPVYKRLFSLR